MDAATHTFVRERAKDCCEYCLLPQQYCSLTHHLEHIISRQHGGSSELDNLALACHRCNLRKGPNLSGLDPAGGNLMRLFNPRHDLWQEHFFLDLLRIKGSTAVGRTTVQVLAMNDARRLELRFEILARRSTD